MVKLTPAEHRKIENQRIFCEYIKRLDALMENWPYGNPGNSRHPVTGKYFVTEEHLDRNHKLLVLWYEAKCLLGAMWNSRSVALEIKSLARFNRPNKPKIAADLLLSRIYSARKHYKDGYYDVPPFLKELLDTPRESGGKITRKQRAAAKQVLDACVSA